MKPKNETIPFNRYLLFLVSATLLCPLLSRGAAATPMEEVRKAAVDWLEALQGKPYTAIFTGADEQPLVARPVNDHLFAFEGQDLYIGLGFRVPPKPTSSLKELQASLAHVALDHLPVPGLQAPAWETYLQTPTSSFKQGVTLESWEEGVLRFRVKTKFFAFRGQQKNLLVPADAGLPEGTYFQVRRDFEGDLTFVGRLFPPPAR